MHACTHAHTHTHTHTRLVPGMTRLTFSSKLGGCIGLRQANFFATVVKRLITHVTNETEKAQIYSLFHIVRAAVSVTDFQHFCLLTHAHNNKKPGTGSRHASAGSVWESEAWCVPPMFRLRLAAAAELSSRCPLLPGDFPFYRQD